MLLSRPKHSVDYVFVLDSKGLNNWTSGNKHAVNEAEMFWDKLEKAAQWLGCRIHLKMRLILGCH